MVDLPKLPTLNQVLGSFLIAEGGLSIVFSPCNNSSYQLGRLARMGIGYYIYKLS